MARYQLIDVLATASYTFTVTLLILVFMTFIRSVSLKLVSSKADSWKWNMGIEIGTDLEDDPQAASSYEEKAQRQP